MVDDEKKIKVTRLQCVLEEYEEYVKENSRLKKLTFMYANNKGADQRSTSAQSDQCHCYSLSRKINNCACYMQYLNIF